MLATLRHGGSARVPPSLLVTGLLCGMLSALGPFAIDFYLPAFPAIARDLHAAPALVQLSLTSYFLALACGPSIYGSWSDRRGRRPVLFGAMALFAAASLACSLATSISALIVLRFLQGLGACGSTVIARAMIRDIARGHAAARLMSTAFVVQGVSPILAPLAGGLLLTVASWRVLFAVILAITLATAVTVWVMLPETHPPSARADSAAGGMLRIYASVLRNRRYMMMCLIAGCATAGGFAFLTATPFIFTILFGLKPSRFSLLLAMMAACQVLATQLCAPSMRRWGLDRHLRVVTITAGLLSLALLAGSVMHAIGLTVFVGLTMGLFACYGLMLTPGAVGALDAAIGFGGSAAALLATIQLLSAALASGSLSALPQHSMVPLAVVATMCAVIGVAAARFGAMPPHAAAS